MDCAIVITFWALFGIVGYYIGQKKAMNPVIAVVAGILLGPFVIFMYFISPEGMKCPKCAERIKKGAVLCRHCGYELTEVEQMTNQ